jgi:hypothetical protein
MVATPSELSRFFSARVMGFLGYQDSSRVRCTVQYSVADVIGPIATRPILRRLRGTALHLLTAPCPAT